MIALPSTGGAARALKDIKENNINRNLRKELICSKIEMDEIDKELIIVSEDLTCFSRILNNL